MKKTMLLIGLYVMLIIFNMDKVLIGTMKVIDHIGYKCNICTVDAIEGLTDIYYMLGYK